MPIKNIKGCDAIIGCLLYLPHMVLNYVSRVVKSSSVKIFLSLSLKFQEKFEKHKNKCNQINDMLLFNIVEWREYFRRVKLAAAFISIISYYIIEIELCFIVTLNADLLIFPQYPNYKWIYNSLSFWTNQVERYHIFY